MSNATKMAFLTVSIVSTIFTLNIAHAASPATAPSPLDTLVAVSKAFAENDAAAYAKTHHHGTPDEEAFCASVQSLLKAQAKILAAYGAKIEPVEKTPFPPELLQIKPLTEAQIIGAKVIPIDANTAEILLPDGVMRFHVVLSEGQWRVQKLPTVGSVYASDPLKGMKAVTARSIELVKAFEVAADEITAGKLATSKAMADALKERLAKIMTATEPSFPRVAGLVLPNDSFNDTKHSNRAFTVGPDPSVKRSSRPALRIASDTAAISQSGNAYAQIDNLAPYLGKRVRFSTYLKCQDAVNSAGIGLVAMSADGKWVAFDFPTFQVIDRPNRFITGTTDWKKLEVVADIPRDAVRVFMGPQLSGRGKLWMDGAKLEVVSDDVPTTDDQNAHLFSGMPKPYTLTLDASVKHDEKPTVRIISEKASQGARCEYVWMDRHAEKFAGHQIRISAWVKTANVTEGAAFKIVAACPKQPDKRIDSEAGQRPITGTSDWQKFEAVAEVPPDAVCLILGLELFGNGTLWIDDLKIDDMEAPDKGL